MKLAIRGHDLGKAGEFDLVSRLKEFGFDGVQFVPYKTYKDIPYSPDGITDERAEALSKELSENGFETYLLGAYFNPVHSNKDKVANSIATFKRYIELASVFKTTVVGSETGSFNDDKWTYNPLNRTDEALDTVVETFTGLCDYAEKFGVNVAFEGASGHVCFKPERLRQAYDRINRKNLKIIFDIYNYLDDENYADYLNIFDKGLELFSGKIHCFHIKDCALVEGKLKQCAIGKGTFDFETLLNKIKRYDENAVLVLEGTTGEDILPSVELIRKIWSK